MTGLKFKVSPSYFNEDSMPLNLPSLKYAEEMALRKAEGVAVKYPDAVIIGADTIVVCKNKILGKPKNEKEAEEILKFACNEISDVLTGVAVIDTKTNRTEKFVDSTKVKMRNYGDEAIKEYVASGAPFRYAGAFAIQDRDWVESIDGSFFNVVGFPVLKVLKILKNFGIIIPEEKIEEIRKKDFYQF